jgi:hypothetical protein
MDKEEYYNKIKNWVYRKFDELEPHKIYSEDTICLRYKNNKYTQIIINKKLGDVVYYTDYRNKICKPIRLLRDDFDILLSEWIEDRFKIKVTDMAGRYFL